MAKKTIDMCSVCDKPFRVRNGKVENHGIIKRSTGPVLCKGAGKKPVKVEREKRMVVARIYRTVKDHKVKAFNIGQVERVTRWTHGGWQTYFEAWPAGARKYAAVAGSMPDLKKKLGRLFSFKSRFSAGGR